MTAFGTVGAVIVAVGIALWSERRSDRRINAERARSDRVLAEQQAQGSAAIEDERAYGRAQLEEGADRREREQLAQAYAVQVVLRRENRTADRVTPPAQPAPAPGTRKQAITEKLLHNHPAAAYREHRCLRAPSRPSPSFAKSPRGGPTQFRHAHAVVAHKPPATQTPGKPHAHRQ